MIRSKKPWMAYLLVPLLMVSSALTLYAGWDAFRGPGVAGRTPAPASPDGVWWMWLGESSAAVVNLGPPLPGSPEQPVRRWIFTVHGPGPEPLLCFQGLVDAASSDPLSLETVDYSVRVEPVPGQTWGEIHHSSQLQSEVTGLD